MLMKNRRIDLHSIFFTYSKVWYYWAWCYWSNNLFLFYW